MIDGVWNIYKEPGMTSADVVRAVRRIARQRKVGHTGTLDPAAEGVLPVCLGQGTRLVKLLTDTTVKQYRAVLLLGKVTDTQDITGKVLAETDPGDSVSEAAVREAAGSFLGTYMQIPPMYSALKVNGKKLCDLAREGIEVEREPRPVEILELSVDSVELPRATLTVTCSHGTYIRTLCHDIGQKLGCGGCMESLVRTRVGMFREEDAVRLAEAERLAEEGRLGQMLITPETILGDYRAFRSDDERLDRLLLNGNPFPGTYTAPEKEEESIRAYDSDGRFAGLYRYRNDREMWFAQIIFPPVPAAGD